MSDKTELKNVIDNSLLHLYVNVANSEKFMTVPARNKVIKTFLEPKLKATKHRLVKSEVKKILLAAKSKKGNLEEKLVKMNDALGKVAKRSQLHDFVALLNLLFENHQIDSKFTNGESLESDVFYVAYDDLELAFSCAEHVMTFPMFIKSEQTSLLIETIDNSGLFTATLDFHDKQSGFSHVVLAAN